MATYHVEKERSSEEIKFKCRAKKLTPNMKSAIPRVKQDSGREKLKFLNLQTTGDAKLQSVLGKTRVNIVLLIRKSRLISLE